ncbi:PIN domain-containing protein [Dyadobacter jiangsuensis]|uniref:Ribonuclease VapC n=1 Tax=Dyadobacter jiangsuensis TaxID=1591085 RepID=A0A2P8G5X2_9BACT|nr:PIN domain-containing protein [Dyadobacter jiangsuensis]PSL29347.1 tRNA(fMet)-specific endonuclease VapC [Dyadobacter jiangsuensis]
MNQYLLDTNICIHYLKGDFDLKKKVRQIGRINCYISEITIAELLFGVENSAPARYQENLKRARKFELAFSAQTLPTVTGFSIYAREKARLRRLGRVIGEFDLLIGSTALRYGLTLVTRNTKDFENLAGIQLENWIDH